MITLKKFLGINNVVTEDRMQNNELRQATNVDIGLTGELLRRKGFTSAASGVYKNLWQGGTFRLATVGTSGNLKNLETGTTLHASLGHTRVWYANLPDGRVAFTNGTFSGITDGTTCTQLGVPVPATLGTRGSLSGNLQAGSYQYWLTYQRTSGDKQESGALYSAPFTLGASSGLSLSSLPALAGHKINVYLSSANGGTPYYVGNTTNTVFAFAGDNGDLTLPLRTSLMQPAPAGGVMAFWRGRVLVAVGSTLYASLTHMWQLFDPKRDFKQFSAPITMLGVIDDGLYVGTEKELVFLSGTEFDKLKMEGPLVDGRVVLGSGVPINAELVKVGDGNDGQPRFGDGDAVIFIADRCVCVGLNGGNVVRMTHGRYETGVTEVCATLRVRDGIPLYTATVPTGPAPVPDPDPVPDPFAFLDTFVGEAGELTLHTSDSGHSWIEDSGWPADRMQLDGDGGVINIDTTPGHSTQAGIDATLPAEFDLTATFVMPDADVVHTGQLYASLMFSFGHTLTPAPLYFEAVIENVDGTINMGYDATHVDNGELFNSYGVDGGAYVDGTDVTLLIQVRAGTITAFIDGVQNYTNTLIGNGAGMVLDYFLHDHTQSLKLKRLEIVEV